MLIGEEKTFNTHNLKAKCINRWLGNISNIGYHSLHCIIILYYNSAWPWHHCLWVSIIIVDWMNHKQVVHVIPDWKYMTITFRRKKKTHTYIYVYIYIYVHNNNRARNTFSSTLMTVTFFIILTTNIDWRDFFITGLPFQWTHPHTVLLLQRTSSCRLEISFADPVKNKSPSPSPVCISTDIDHRAAYLLCQQQ